MFPKSMAPPKAVTPAKTAPTTKVNTIKSDRVANQKTGEKALNHLEGITNAKQQANKNAKGKGKNNKIRSTDKSEQNLKNQLKNTKTLKDAKDNF